MGTVSHQLAPVYRPRRPRSSPLYQLIERYYPEFERTDDDRYERRYGPWRAVIGTVCRRFLRCGDLHFGFARVRCQGCCQEMFVPFSCRQRCVCPQLSSETEPADGTRHRPDVLPIGRSPGDRVDHSQTTPRLLPLRLPPAGRPGPTRASASTTASVWQRATGLDWSDWPNISSAARFGLARVVRLTEEGSVIYRAEKDHCRRFPGPASADFRGGPRRNFQVFSALDFLAELTQHIPDKGEHLVRYYGWYSHRHRGMRAKSGSGSSGSDTFFPTQSDAPHTEAVGKRCQTRMALELS